MSTVPISTPSKAGKGKKEKEKLPSQPEQNERLKIVVRRLPPNLPEDLFWQSVQRWVTDETTTWKVFGAGKLRKKLNKESIPSRAYIAFKTQEQVALFSREYDGHIFRDKNGVESQAVVEFAPYQKIPPEKKKVDNRNGTIEKDEDYISFLESLKAASNAEPISLDDLIASAQPPPLPKTTPLLEALKAEKTAAKDKESILRNHAHYKQAEVAVRKGDKKRAPTAPAVVPPRPATEPPASNPPSSLGKKAAKRAQAQALAQAQAAAAVQAAATLAPGNNKTEPLVVLPAPNPRVLHPPAPGPSRPPRPPKAPRGAQQGKTDSPAAAPAIVTAQNITMENPIGTLPTEPSRRTRPVIGIASRQFEAALNIAGLASSASERRKREKEKLVDTQNPTNDIGAGPSRNSSKGGGNDIPSEGQDILLKPSSTDGLDPDKPGPLSPSSPKKEKSKRGGRVGASGRGSAPVKIPSILQRTDAQRNEGQSQTVPMIMQRSAPSGSEVTPAPIIPEPPPPPAPVGGSNTVPRGRGRPRGGRGGGGGRGRGGQPSAPRGGG